MITAWQKKIITIWYYNIWKEKMCNCEKEEKKPILVVFTDVEGSKATNSSELRWKLRYAIALTTKHSARHDIFRNLHRWGTNWYCLLWDQSTDKEEENILRYVLENENIYNKSV